MFVFQGCRWCACSVMTPFSHVIAIQSRTVRKMRCAICWPETRFEQSQIIFWQTMFSLLDCRNIANTCISLGKGIKVYIRFKLSRDERTYSLTVNKISFSFCLFVCFLIFKMVVKKKTKYYDTVFGIRITGPL